jgi:cytochrome oxidase assembly protein ShyY1
MFALLRTRRWMSFTLLVVFVISGFGLLSRWQWGRAEAKRIDRVALESASSASPIPLPKSQTLKNSREWSKFIVSGHFVAADQVVVRKRPLNGTNGYWVLTMFKTREGDSVWVNRGWMPAKGIATAMPAIPQPVTSSQTITGAWRYFEAASPEELNGLPNGMVPAPAPEVLPIPGSIPGYLQITDPAQTGLELVPNPEIDEGQNISYAVQWILFAAVAIIGWFIFLRREAAEDARTAEV